MKAEWQAMISDKRAKWADMWAQYAREGLTPVDLYADKEPAYPHCGAFRGKLLLLPAQKEARGTVIVLAGGAFLFQSSNEARPVAAFFRAAGFNAAVLDYNTDPEEKSGFGVQLAACEDALRAVRYVRAHAAELGVKQDKIALGGFSAGGMTTALAATRYAGAEDRPDAALLWYGAFSSTTPRGEGMGYDAARQRELAACDPVRNLRPDSPPFFLFQTHADDPRIALSFGTELAARGIPFEIHTFEGGPHGGALYDAGDEGVPNEPHTARWATLAASWLRGKGF